MTTSPERVEAIWTKIRDLKPIIHAHREEGDRLRHLPPAVADAFFAADLYRLQIPTDLGGAGLDAMTVFDMVEEVSSYDGSAGWNLAIGAGSVAMTGSLPLDRLREIFATPNCCVAATGNPPGRATAVDGGYLLSGRWSWASGVHQSSLVGGSARVFDGETPRVSERGGPVMRFFFLPTSKAHIYDTWITGGMKGTGSTEWEVSDFFVPERDVAQPFTKASHPAPIFNLPSSSFGYMTCAVPLGIARNAVNALKELAAKSDLKKQGYVRYAVAKAQVLQESAHLNIRDAFRGLWESVLENQSPAPDQRARSRRAMVHAVESSVQAVTLCTEAAGGSAVYQKWPFARALSDVHALQGHAVLSRRFMEFAGQAMLGDPVEHPIF